ncbi:MAG: hypothetical protein ACRCX2_19840 [Paraclostridium sp.]
MDDKFGFIEQIDESKFKCGGTIYVNSNISEDKETTIQAKIASMRFDNKIYDIVNKVNGDREDKDLSARTSEIEGFLNEKETDILDIIFFADGGFRNNNHIVMEENSIFYIKVSENVKFGFFVNKAISRAIMGGYKNVSETK